MHEILLRVAVVAPALLILAEVGCSRPLTVKEPAQPSAQVPSCVPINTNGADPWCVPEQARQALEEYRQSPTQETLIRLAVLLHQTAQLEFVGPAGWRREVTALWMDMFNAYDSLIDPAFEPPITNRRCAERVSLALLDWEDAAWAEYGRLGEDNEDWCADVRLVQAELRQDLKMDVSSFYFFLSNHYPVTEDHRQRILKTIDERIRNPKVAADLRREVARWWMSGP